LARDRDLVEDTLDDLDLDHAVFHVLVGDDRAGIDVAALDVKPSKRIAHIQELLGRDRASGIGRCDLGQLAIRNRGVSARPELANEHPDAARGAAPALE
jgi:hypothetical protein